jgi:hypothetical protein
MQSNDNEELAILCDFVGGWARNGPRIWKQIKGVPLIG